MARCGELWWSAMTPRVRQPVRAKQAAMDVASGSATNDRAPPGPVRPSWRWQRGDFPEPHSARARLTSCREVPVMRAEPLKPAGSGKYPPLHLLPRPPVRFGGFHTGHHPPRIKPELPVTLSLGAIGWRPEVVLDDRSPIQDPRHQPMGAVLPFPIRIVSEPHRLAMTMNSGPPVLTNSGPPPC